MKGVLWLNIMFIVKCKDNSLYTGYTTNVEARIATHNAGKGAKTSGSVSLSRNV